MGTAMDTIPFACPSRIYVSSSPALALAQQLTICDSLCTPAHTETCRSRRRIEWTSHSH